MTKASAVSSTRVPRRSGHAPVGLALIAISFAFVSTSLAAQQKATGTTPTVSPAPPAKPPKGAGPSISAPPPPAPPAGPTSSISPTPAPGAPVYAFDPLPTALEQEFQRKNYKRDPKSGNYLSPKVSSKTVNEDLVPVRIDGRWVKDLKGHTVFLRESIRAKLLKADEAMFKKEHKHIVVTYGFRSNAVQQDLFKKINGNGVVAPAGGSFHETGMALDISNWRDAQAFMIDAGFVGGCYGIEEDFVHYSVGEVTKASNMTVFKRCTLKEIPKKIGKGIVKVGSATIGVFKRDKDGDKNKGKNKGKGK